MRNVPTFELALARRFTELRKRHQLPLEDIAAGAQSLGLDWTRGKVWAIENVAKSDGTAGTRRLSVSEFLALPAIFERALRQRGVKDTFTLHDFLPRDDEVSIGVFVIPGEALASILRGSSFNFDRFEDPWLSAAREASTARSRVVDMVARQELPETAHRIERSARGAVERSVAKKLGVPSELVAIASEQHWNKPLTSHRNELIGAAPDGLSKDEEMAWRNAARGHATRAILGDEEFCRIVDSLFERYGTMLEKDPDSPGGANDPRTVWRSPPGQSRLLHDDDV